MDLVGKVSELLEVEIRATLSLLGINDHGLILVRELASSGSVLISLSQFIRFVRISSLDCGHTRCKRSSTQPSCKKLQKVT